MIPFFCKFWPFKIPTTSPPEPKFPGPNGVGQHDRFGFAGRKATWMQATWWFHGNSQGHETPFMVSGTHTIPTIPISLGNSYGSASHIPKKKLLTSQSLLKAMLVGAPLLAGLCRKSQPLLAHTRFLTLGVIMLQEWNMEWLDNVNWWSLNSSMHMSTYMYVARSAKQLQHEVKHASLYTQLWRLKEKSRLPNSFTSHHSFWQNKPHSSSCYTNTCYLFQG